MVKIFNTQLYKQYRNRVKKVRYYSISDVLKLIFTFVVLSVVCVVISPSNWLKNTEVNYLKAVNALDLRIREIEILGLDRLNDMDLKKSINVKLGDNIMTLDINAIKTQIEDEPWVKSAFVERILPDKLLISITEEVSQAIFIEKEKKFLINRHGKILQQIFEISDYSDYVIINGNGGNFEFESLLDQLHSFQDTFKQIESINFINARRWDIQLKNKFLIKLPETKIDEALEIFENIFNKNFKLQKICVVDLRLIPDKIYLKILS